MSQAETTAAAARYRLLTQADTIQRGDEVLGDDAATWTEMTRSDLSVGARYNALLFMPIRRRDGVNV